MKKNIDVICGALLFLLFPVVSIPYSLYKMVTEECKKKQYIYILFLCCAIGFLAYHTVPLESDDLSRHYANMKILQYTEFKDIFHSSYSLVYLNTIIMYVCAILGKYQLYPFLYVTIGYGLISLVFAKVTEKKKLSVYEKITIFLFAFFAVNCRDFISGLRNYFSFIVCMFLIVSEKVFHQKKMYTYIGIVCVSFIHTSAIAFLVWELVSNFVKRGTLKNIVMSLTLLTLPMLVLVSLGVIPFVPPMIVDKLEMYISTAQIINLKVYIYQIGIVLLTAGCHLINRRQNVIKYRRMNAFLDYYIVFMIAILPIMIFLSRFVYFLVALSPVVFIQTYSWIGENKKLKIAFGGILWCFILAGIVMLLASMRAYPWNFDLKNIFIWWL